MQLTSSIAHRRHDKVLGDEIHKDILTRLTKADREVLVDTLNYAIHRLEDKDSNSDSFLQEMALMTALMQGRRILREFQIFFWDLIAWKNNYGLTERLYLKLEEN